MKPLSFAVVVLGLLVCFPSNVEAAKKPAKKPAPKVDLSADSKNADSSQFLTEPLIASDTVAKLKLTAEQKPQVDKLQREFAAKLKEIADKLKNTPAQAGDAKPAKGKKGTKAANPANDLLQEAVKLREDYEEKLNDLLTDSQKTILEEIRAKKAEALLNAGGTKTTPTKTPAKK
jgi:hypothetical protein